MTPVLFLSLPYIIELISYFFPRGKFTTCSNRLELVIIFFGVFNSFGVHSLDVNILLEKLVCESIHCVRSKYARYADCCDNILFDFEESSPSSSEGIPIKFTLWIVGRVLSPDSVLGLSPLCVIPIKPMVVISQIERH